VVKTFLSIIRELPSAFRSHSGGIDALFKHRR